MRTLTSALALSLGKRREPESRGAVPVASRWWLVLLCSLSALRCGPACTGTVDPPPPPPPEDAGPPIDPPVATGRCDLDLEPYRLPGWGARVIQVTASSELIGGPNAQGRVGDWLLSNDKVKVVVQGFDRHIGAQPYGGTLLDADLVRSGPGQDQLGEVGLLYNFGRTLDPTRFDVLADGSAGGPAILAVTGPDAPNDYLSIRNQLKDTLGRVPIADPYAPLPLLVTNYFVLNPGEQRVRFLTALCNTGVQGEALLSVGDLADPGYTVEFFNGQSCTGGFGYGGLCYGLDRMSWFGYLGDGVAYGYAPNQVNSPSLPEAQNALLTIAGITGSLVGANGLAGLLSWFDPAVQTRQGELRIAAGGKGVLGRDFVIGRDLGEVASIIEQTRARARGSPSGEVSGTVSEGGAPLPGARVTFRTADELVAVFTTGAAGKYQGVLAARAYTVSAWAKGRQPSANKAVTVSATPVQASFDLVAPRRLTVNVREAGGGPMPGKVTVLCGTGVCPVPSSALVIYADVPKDPMLANMQAVAFAGADGVASLELPPAQYSVVVSRGPEYSIFPNGWPASGGVAVDLRAADATLEASLAHVIDSTGYLSADLHVHAVNSPDSIVDNTTRVLGFAADGIDVLVSTDHDYVTDYAPVIQQTGLEPFLASVIGEEISTMDFGHYNLFPFPRDASDVLTGGAVDWAGGRGATFSPAELFAEARRKGARTVQVNHPRGYLGGFTHMRVDLDTLATHANPADYRMNTPPNATATDTKLMSSNFNALELLNPGDDSFDPYLMHGRFNDWFTLLSRGLKVAGTGVSDSHSRSLVSGWRTFIKVGNDVPSDLDPDAMSDALNGLKAFAGNGPFVNLRVFRVDAAGTQVSLPAGIGETLGPSTNDLGVTVEVQVPEYLDVTRVELYMHRPGDDASCPLDPQGPNAATTRVACDGQMNLNWPASGITASQSVTLSPANLETVKTVAGVSYRRYRVAVTFRLPAPSTDNWLVAMVYGSKSLFPLLYLPGSGTVKPIAPFAFTNPVFIDADGNGFDHPPFKPLPAAPRPPAPRAPRPPPQSELEALHRWGDWVSGH